MAPRLVCARASFGLSVTAYKTHENEKNEPFICICAIIIIMPESYEQPALIDCF
jgi:hypothetical protein